LVEQCPRLRFLLVGDGPRRAELERATNRAGLDRYFRFTGLVPPEDIPALVGIMDLLVHLSRREGLPRALAQSLAAGRPVVAYDCDGAREVCLHQETGLLVALGDLRALQQALLRLATSPPLRAQLGDTGRRLVRDLFPVEKMIERLHLLYLQLAQLPPTVGVGAAPARPGP
jgi:glycosyltransferase involved in cell wall biosynthesis